LQQVLLQVVGWPQPYFIHRAKIVGQLYEECKQTSGQPLTYHQARQIDYNGIDMLCKVTDS